MRTYQEQDHTEVHCLAVVVGAYSQRQSADSAEEEVLPSEEERYTLGLGSFQVEEGEVLDCNHGIAAEVVGPDYNYHPLVLGFET